MRTKQSLLGVFVVLLLYWPGALTSPSMQQDINQNTGNGISFTGHGEESIEFTLIGKNPGRAQIEEIFESTVQNDSSCYQFMINVDSYLEGGSMIHDFQQGKPTLLMILRKIFPQFSFAMDHIATEDIRKMVAKQFCPAIKFKHFLDQKMGKIGRNILQIWKSKNFKEVMESMKEIGEELTITMEILARKVEEVEQFYVEDLKNLYKATTVIGPKVAKTIKAIGKIENEARQIRWALKGLGKTTVRRSGIIIRSLQNLINGTTSKEVDMERMLRYTANLLKTSYDKLGKSIKSYERMTTELDALVVDLKTYDTKVTKITSDIQSEYSRKSTEGYIKIAAASIGTAISGVLTAFGLADGTLGALDVIGPTALAGAIYGVVSDSMAMSHLVKVNSDIESDLAVISTSLQKYIHSSGELQQVLILEQESARQWYDIVKEIQDDFGKDLGFLEEALENTDYVDELLDAKEMFCTLKEQAQGFLEILAKNKKTTDAIHLQFKNRQNKLE